MNTLVIAATVQAIEPLRYTPAGLPLLRLQLQHDSEQQEAGLNRKVQCQLAAVLIGEKANLTLQSGDQIKVKGFLAQRSAKSTQVVMHIQEIQLIQHKELKEF
ncbi:MULTISPECIES: primosomal replication protein N [unclassified Methylophilus]|uniref:primosomal replication protein N n=1 Tax=unclassified Methylophilus TaxID=2630143 RepID=UPI0006FAB1AA|nr:MULTISPECIES: primosomal replication protein N [unclassified Methylophilus]KQT37776.1 prepilin peptidase [Methylophilus sp. Leaf414]KQT43515.1 prepilin peptidase [Methylophilus sp. Leaf416]KQT59001.1 prepilin peptidase [Methylophilus sp. Leaf459]